MADQEDLACAFKVIDKLIVLIYSNTALKKWCSKLEKTLSLKGK